MMWQDIWGSSENFDLFSSQSQCPFC